MYIGGIGGVVCPMNPYLACHACVMALSVAVNESPDDFCGRNFLFFCLFFYAVVHFFSHSHLYCVVFCDLCFLLFFLHELIVDALLSGVKVKFAIFSLVLFSGLRIDLSVETINNNYCYRYPSLPVNWHDTCSGQSNK